MENESNQMWKFGALSLYIEYLWVLKKEWDLSPWTLGNWYFLLLFFLKTTHHWVDWENGRLSTMKIMVSCSLSTNHYIWCWTTGCDFESQLFESTCTRWANLALAHSHLNCSRFKLVNFSKFFTNKWLQISESQLCPSSVLSHWSSHYLRFVWWPSGGARPLG